jgi:peptidoglycan lytic transglycosylase G
MIKTVNYHVLKKVLVGGAGAFVLFLVILGWLYYRQTKYEDTPEPGIMIEKLVTIKQGMSFSEASRMLSQKGVISQYKKFIILAKRKGVTTRMQAGDYTLRPGMTPAQILDTITRGDITTVRLVVPEGFTATDIAKRLSASGPWKEKLFISITREKSGADELEIPITNMEGYLFPATYEMKMSMTERDVINTMLSAAKRVETKERLKLAKNAEMTWHEVLTMASLIQKETRRNEEMPRIASVFHNRLKKNMRLQSDPTAVYGIDDFKGPIKKTDLLRLHDYNTYIHQGLPPGPICSPGVKAVNAVLIPEITEYLYFVADGEGGHKFAKTYSEHRKNVKEYKKKAKANKP